MNSDALDILAWTLLGEAAGEGDVGMAAVAHTIRNRTNDPRWPDDPMAVALQPNQYSTWNDTRKGGNSPSKRYPRGSEAFQNARRIAEAVFAGSIPDPTGGATHYHTTSVKPTWADDVNRFGAVKIGAHQFYPEHPVPPAELPQVATALDVVPPRTPPVPVTPSPDLSLMRNPAMNPLASTGGRLPPPLPIPRPRNNTMAGADLALTGNINPTTSRMRDDGEVLNPFFSDLTPTAVVGGVGSLTPGRVPPVPASPFERVTARNNALPPMLLPPLPPPGARRQAPVPATPSFPLQAARIAAGAVRPELDAALGPDNIDPIPERLTASPAGLPGVGMSPTQVAAIGTDTSGATTAIGGPRGAPSPVMPSAALQARRNRPTPPLPIPRPGTGGPVIPPTPAERLERPGVFGDRQLPGVFGIINSISKAANNSSGPFSNPVDNLLVNVFRGGSFATPGAADAVGTNGFLYARRPDGGYVNVGRAGGYQRPQSNRPTLMGWLQSNLPQSTPSSSPSSQPSRSLRPGDRRYNPDTNTWEIK